MIESSRAIKHVVEELHPAGVPRRKVSTNVDLLGADVLIKSAFRKRPAHVENVSRVPVEGLAAIVEGSGPPEGRIDPVDTGNIPGDVGHVINGDRFGRNILIELLGIVENMLDVIEITGVQIRNGRAAITRHPPEGVFSDFQLIGATASNCGA